MIGIKANYSFDYNNMEGTTDYKLQTTTYLNDLSHHGPVDSAVQLQFLLEPHNGWPQPVLHLTESLL